MTDRIQEALNEFLDVCRDVANEAAQDAIKTVLGGGGAIRTGSRGRPRIRAISGNGRRGRSGKRDPKALDALTAKLHAQIKSKPGQGMESLAATLGTTTKELVLPAKRLLAEKKVATKGQKRATKYFAK